jgi:hypothetical protein
MNFKKILPITLGLTLMVPIAASANSENTSENSIRFRSKFPPHVAFVEENTELTDDTKAQLQEIRTQLKNNELTFSEAKELMADLGLDFCSGKPMNRIEISDDVKAQLNEIRSLLENEEITKDEAQELMADLGLERLNQRGNNLRKMKQSLN